MNKIIFVIQTLGVGGAERVLVHYLNSIDRTQFEPILVSFQSKGDFFHLLAPSIRVIRFDKKKPYHLIKIFFQLWHVFIDEKPDIIVSFIDYANVLTILASKFCFYKHKVIVRESNMLSELYKHVSFAKLRTLAVKILYPQSSQIIVNSIAVKNDLVSKFSLPQNKIIVLYNPIDIMKIHVLMKQKPKISCFTKNTFTIVSVGRLELQKNFPLLLKSFASLPIKEKELIILGRGKENSRLRDLARMLSIGKTVHFIGFQKNPFAYVKRADCFILSSQFEGCPNVILEAFVCGTPVISVNFPGVQEFVTHGINGLITKKDPQEIARAALLLFNNRSLKNKIASNAEKTVQRFDITKQSKMFYQSIS